MTSVHYQSSSSSSSSQSSAVSGNVGRPTALTTQATPPHRYDRRRTSDGSAITMTSPLSSSLSSGFGGAFPAGFGGWSASKTYENQTRRRTSDAVSGVLMTPITPSNDVFRSSDLQGTDQRIKVVLTKPISFYLLCVYMNLFTF